MARADGSFDYGDYVRGALAAGRTANGVFAARLMWGTLDEVTEKLRAVHRDRRARDVDLLIRTFGDTRFIHLYRHDVVAQAVSWLRAEQTNVWARIEGLPTAPELEPQFDLGALDELCRTINEHNAAWRDWFTRNDVEPYPLRYEDLDRDPEGVTRDVLAFLALELPPRTSIRAHYRRQADRLSAQWIERYRARMSP